MTNIPIENTILFSLLIIFFSIILFLKKISNKTLIIAGIIFILLAINFFYYEFLTDKTSSEVELQSTISNWGLFGSYFGGVVTPILTFITLIILLKQINETQIANNLQIEHLNKTRRIESLTERINYTANQANEKIDKVHSLDEDIVKIYIKSDKELSELNLSLQSITNDYNNKITNVYLSNSEEFPLEWQSIIHYINMYINEYADNAEEKLNSFMKIELHNILVLINKTIALCLELSNLDEHSYQFVKFALTNFSYTIEELYKLNKIDKEKYELFYKLISIHNNNEDSIKENNLKKLFAKELSNKYRKNLTENDLSIINFSLLNGEEEYKVGQFTTEIEGTTYLRIDGNWINGKEILKRRMENNHIS